LKNFDSLLFFTQQEIKQVDHFTINIDDVPPEDIQVVGPIAQQGAQILNETIQENNPIEGLKILTVPPADQVILVSG